MNDFMRITKEAIQRHGRSSVYIQQQESQYDIATGTVNVVSTQHPVRMYKKHIRANQYMFPNLIDKDVALFYICNDNLNFNPKIQDLIEYNSEVYSVYSIQSHEANGQVILFKITGVKQ